MMKTALGLLAFTVFFTLAAYADNRGAVNPGTAARAAADPCEKVGRRVYDLCMAGPKAERTACLNEYDAAYLRCAEPDQAAAGGAATPV